MKGRIDLAHLLGSLPRGQNAAATPEGFLGWVPGTDETELSNAVEEMLSAVGESGCGFEAQLESWYRFLADPFPYRSLARVQCPGSTSTGLNCVQQETDTDGCDCFEGALDRPLCEEVPGVSEAGTTQYWARAYPGGRHLEVLKGIGSSGVVSSICARNTTDTGAEDFATAPPWRPCSSRCASSCPEPVA